MLPFCGKHDKFTTRIFPKLRRATLDNGVLICCVITTVILYEIQKLAKIGGKRRRRERLINVFLVRLTYIETFSLFDNLYWNYETITPF